MIKIGNTYIPEETVTVEVKAINKNKDNSFSLVLKSLASIGTVYQLCIKPTSEEAYWDLFGLIDQDRSRTKELQELCVGELGQLKP